jgi:hypothetical protein
VLPAHLIVTPLTMQPPSVDQRPPRSPLWPTRLTRLTRPTWHHVLCCGAVLLLMWASLWPAPVRAQGVELVTLQTSRNDAALNLDFVARVTLPKTVEDALRSGVPIYFVAEARLQRSRWYWRDERIARVQRSWRIAYQPLTGFWRVGLGGLNQNHASLEEAIAAASSSASWKLADLAQLENEKDLYVEFNYRLDTTQLPGPMQFGLGGQANWAVGLSRTLKVAPGP